jgi:hypothetical protein
VDAKRVPDPFCGSLVQISLLGHLPSFFDILQMIMSGDSKGLPNGEIVGLLVH